MRQVFYAALKAEQDACLINKLKHIGDKEQD